MALTDLLVNAAITYAKSNAATKEQPQAQASAPAQASSSGQINQKQIQKAVTIALQEALTGKSQSTQSTESQGQNQQGINVQAVAQTAVSIFTAMKQS